MHIYRHGQRVGLTLIESLVVIGILGILMALLLPAIQYVRESSRRTLCIARIKQLSQAISAYEANCGWLPPGLSFSFSWHVMVLPHLENSAIYDAINYNFFDSNERNTTVAMTRLFIFLCPSDANGEQLRPGIVAGTNYAGNMGTGHLAHGYNGLFTLPHLKTPFHEPAGLVKLSDVLDGVTNTAAIAEALISDGTHDRLRVVYKTSATRHFPNQQPEFAQECRLATAVHDPWHRGRGWTNGNPGITLYNHVLPPFSNTCFNGSISNLSGFRLRSSGRGGLPEDWWCKDR